MYSNFIFQPEPQGTPHPRVRNILTLEERVRAINAYDRKPMYTKVASMFHCSWEQIKNIVQNRKAIMDFYEATKKTYSNSDPDGELIRQRKINFLGECLYEYIQRAQYHKKADLNEEIIRVKAIEFRELIQIENFTPVKAWINHFKATFNISLSQRQITLTRTPPGSLDLKDIMTYCSRYKTTTDKQSQPQQSGQNLYKLATTMAVTTANEATLEEMKQRRQRKITFLMKALYEYIQRSQYHHRMTLNEEHLRKIACEFKDMLKIDSFYPNKAWFNHFKSIYDFSTSQRTIVFSRAPPFSLDLKDILSYCSRHDAKNLPTPVPIKKLPLKNVQKDEVKIEKSQTLERGKTVEQGKIRVINHTQLAAVKTIEIADDDQEIDVKPDLAELEDIKEKPDELVEPPPLKKPKLEVVDENSIEKPVHSPGHWSEHSGDDEEELPKKVTNYTDALKLLKPLEEFAMLEENYRVIGLVSQLEEIFKNPPKS